MNEYYGRGNTMSGAASGTGSLGGDVKRVGQVEEQLQRLVEQCDRIEKARETMRNRLQGVSRGTGMANKLEPACAPEPELVSVANLLRTINRRLAETHDDLMQMVNAVEL